MKKGSQRLALEAFSLILLVCDLVSVFFHCGVLVVVVGVLFGLFVVIIRLAWPAKTIACRGVFDDSRRTARIMGRGISVAGSDF